MRTVPGMIRYGGILINLLSTGVVDIANNPKACAPLVWAVSWPSLHPFEMVHAADIVRSLCTMTRLWRLWWGPDTFFPAICCPIFLILWSRLKMLMSPLSLWMVLQGSLSDSTTRATCSVCSPPHRLWCPCAQLLFP